MPHPASLMTFGALSAVAIALGADLGRATADNINPAYTEDDGASSYSDPTPNPASRSDWAQVQVQEYQAAQGPPPPPACVQCSWPVAPVPRHDPIVDRALAAWTPRSEPEQAAVADPAPDPAIARLVRYADAAPAADPAPQPDPPKAAAAQSNPSPTGP